MHVQVLSHNQWPILIPMATRLPEPSLVSRSDEKETRILQTTCHPGMLLEVRDQEFNWVRWPGAITFPEVTGWKSVAKQGPYPPFHARTSFIKIHGSRI